jgi:hypothetical protein
MAQGMGLKGVGLLFLVWDRVSDGLAFGVDFKSRSRLCFFASWLISSLYIFSWGFEVWALAQTYIIFES